MAEHKSEPLDVTKAGDQLVSAQIPPSGGVAFGSGGGPDLPAIPTGTFRTWRKMRGNPTIALGRAVRTVPVRHAPLAVESKDDVSDDQVKMVQEFIDDFGNNVVREMMFALEFGHATFEKVFVVDSGMLKYSNIKYLIPENVTAIIDKDTGDLLGAKVNKVEVPADKLFWFVHEREGDNFLGRSIYENIREDAWFVWQQEKEKLLKLLIKISSIMPIIEYPEGRSRDANGSEQDNFDIAKNTILTMEKGAGVAMPNTYMAGLQELIKRGVNIKDFKAWTISFLETKTGHATEIISGMRHAEANMLRGMLVPERGVIEGEHGTKAEAEVHGALAVEISELLLRDVVEAINKGLIDPLLVANFGPDARGQVFIKRAGLDSSTREFFKVIFEKTIAEPMNLDVFMDLIDLDVLIDSIGLPKAAERVADRGLLGGNGQDPDVLKKAAAAIRGNGNGDIQAITAGNNSGRAPATA